MTTFGSVARADFEVVRRTKRKVKANKAHQTKNCSKTRNDSFPFIRSYEHKIEGPKHYLTWLIRAISGRLCVCERPEKKTVQATHRWRQQKRFLKSRVNSPYYNLHRDYFSLLPTSIVKRRRIVLEMNSWESHPSSEKERKFRRSLFTSLYQKKCRTDMQSCCFASLWLLLFWRSPCRHRPGILNWFPKCKEPKDRCFSLFTCCIALI